MLRPPAWGVRDATDWNGTRRAIADIQAEGHDAIVEPFLNGSDIEVPVITCGGRPAILPMMEFAQSDPCHLRTYQEKRDLVEQGAKYRMVPFNRGEWNATLADYAQRLAGLFFRSIRAFRVSSQ